MFINIILYNPILVTNKYWSSIHLIFVYLLWKYLQCNMDFWRYSHFLDICQNCLRNIVFNLTNFKYYIIILYTFMKHYWITANFYAFFVRLKVDSKFYLIKSVKSCDYIMKKILLNFSGNRKLKIGSYAYIIIF